jgi:hypothetical protein
MNARLKVSGHLVRGIGLAIMAIALVVSAAGPGSALAQPSQAPASQAVAQIGYDSCPGSGNPTTIRISDVANLYSAHLKIKFDNAYLKITSITTNSSVFASGTIAPMDIDEFNTNGEISFIATLENPQEPISGTGPLSLFTINWEIIGPCKSGSVILTIPPHEPPVPPNPPQLSDRNGKDIPYTAASPCILTDCPDGGCSTVSGKVLLQGRTDYSGTDIMLSTDRDCPTNFTYSALWDWPGVLKAKTAADGSFSLDPNDQQQCRCLYAFKHGYLTALGQGPYPYTGTVTMQDITLSGGDVTQDDAINIFDLTLVATHYGADVSTNPEAAQADINGDNKVNIYDLALAAGNSGVARGPQQWSR